MIIEKNGIDDNLNHTFKKNPISMLTFTSGGKIGWFSEKKTFLWW